MLPKGHGAFDPAPLLAQVAYAGTTLAYRAKCTVFSQGDAADAVYYIQTGKVKVTVVSMHGKEAVIAMLGATDFLGEACLAYQSNRLTTATTITECSLLRIQKDAMLLALHNDAALSDRFITYLLGRTMRVEEDLVDHLFNSSEKRLARILLLLARYGTEDEPAPTIPPISQETLAEMVGTTRARVSVFMNKFRRLGFIDYSNDRLEVHSSLLNVVLQD